jgi:hypothetical protein
MTWITLQCLTKTLDHRYQTEDLRNLLAIHSQQCPKNTDMASSLILFLLPVVLAIVLLRRHFEFVYYRFEKVVTDILGFGHADSASTNTPRTRRCFRISDIPNTWGKDQLVQALKAEQPGLDEEQVQLFLYQSCNGTGQTAVLYLTKCSKYFCETSAEETTFLTLPSEGSTVTVSVDSHFHDLAPLNSPRSPIIAE